MVEVVAVWCGAWFGVVVDGLAAEPAGRVVLFALLVEGFAGLGEGFGVLSLAQFVALLELFWARCIELVSLYTKVLRFIGFRVGRRVAWDFIFW